MLTSVSMSHKKSWSSKEKYLDGNSHHEYRTARRHVTCKRKKFYSHIHVIFTFSSLSSVRSISCRLCCCSSIYLLTTIFRCQTKLSFLAKFAENKQQHLHTLLGFIFRFYVASSYRANFFLSPPRENLHQLDELFAHHHLVHCEYKSLGVVIYGFDELRKSLSLYFYYNHRRRSASRASFRGSRFDHSHDVEWEGQRRNVHCFFVNDFEIPPLSGSGSCCTLHINTKTHLST